jgi:uncharacterized membrane protein YhaH (DUF805 family)
MPSPVFISYRRADTQHVAARLFSRLAPRYLAEADIFMDVEAIAAGADYTSVLHSQLDGCQVCLVMIGPQWLAIDSTGARRLDNPDDVVRQEIVAALARKITVIPVLVDNARMPSASELPAPLKPLAVLNAARLTHENFHTDADALGAKVLGVLGRSVDLEQDVLKLLFSFKGAIGRKQYWIGFLIITAAQFAIMAGLLAISGVPIARGFTDSADLPMQSKLLLQLGTLWVWWPALALAYKRIKDLGHGFALFAPMLAASIGQVAFDLLGWKSEAGALSLVCLMLILMLGTIKGTRFVAHAV